MNAHFVRYLLMGILFLGAFACSDEQDFDQFDDLTITPTLASSIFSVEADEPFINSFTVVNTFYTNTFNFDAFNEDFVAERLLEGTITYEFENTTSKPLIITVEFLDEGGGVLDTEIFDIPAGPAPAFTIEVDYGPGGKPLDILANTSDIRITGINLGDTTSTSSEPDPKIVMKSAADFVFRLE